MPRGIYLTAEQKEQIVALYKTGLTQCEVAERFGVSQNTVSRVVHPSGYDRTHIGSQIARSIPVANVEPRKGPSEPVQRETAKNSFRVTSRTLKLHSEATGHTYTVSTETDVVDVESDNALMQLPIQAIDAFIEELQQIKAMLGNPQ